MRAGPALLLLLLALAYQGLAAPLYRVGSVTPDFPFLALAYLALFAAPLDLLLLGALTALTIDLVSLDPLGTRLVGYLPALLLLNRLRLSPVAASPLPRAALILLASLLAFGFQGAYVGWWEGCWSEGRWLTAGLELKAAIYTSSLGVPAHAGLDRHRAALGWARDRF